MAKMLTVLMCVTAGLVCVAAKQANNSLAGTWKLNLSKSKYQGTRAPQSLTVTVEDRGDGLIVMRSEATMDDGSSNVTAGAFKCDGKNYPFVLRQDQSIPLSIACIETARARYELDLKLENGQPLQKTLRTVAEDGKTMTDTMTAFSPDGQSVRVLAVFEKQ
jgi:hypothetical protein